MRNLRDELGRRPLWGAFIGSNSALAAEIMAQAGFDWLVIDLQHAPTGGSEQLAAMLRATGSTPTLVRIPWKTDYGTAVDRDGDGLAQLAAELGGSVTGVECDVTDLSAIDEMARGVVRRFGAVDILVNNAGGNRRVLPHEVTLADWRHVSDLNLMSCFFVSQRIGLQMIAQRRGSIVNISSTCGCSAMGRGNIVFSAAKAGINHLTRELALEWGASGIRVNAIAPSQVDSAGMRQWMGEAGADGRLMGDTLLGGVPLGRLVRAEDIVGPALFLASDASRMVTGTVIPVDGGNLSANLSGTVGRPITVESGEPAK